MLRLRCALALCAIVCINTVHQSTTCSRAGTAAASQGSVRHSNTTRRSPQWYLSETANFRVYCCSGDREAERLGQRCEQLRQQLSSIWLGTTDIADWDKPCDVVVFPSMQAYLQVVGREAAQTAGSALIQTDGPTVLSRRIDLRGDMGRDMESALAHELTHVVIADRLDRSRLPAWADEGMAVLADTPEKQSLHLADLQQGLRSRQTFRCGELLTLQGYPQPQRMGVFYGQACSLVNFLVHRGTPEQFVKFLELSMSRGYDAALREVYEISNVAQLENLWQQSLRGGNAQFASHLRASIWTTKKVSDG